MNLDLTYFYTTQQNNASELDLFHNYYQGVHEMYFNTIRKFPKLNDLVHGIKSNLCRPIIDVLISRMEVQTVKTDNDEANDFIDKYFAENRLTSLMKAVCRDTFLYGSSYVSVWLDANGEIKLYKKTPYSTIPHYNGEGELDSVVSFKQYRDIKNNPRTSVWVYYNDKIYKTDYEGEYFTPTLDVNESYDNIFNSIPIFHFCNSTDKTNLIDSDIKDVIPIQRAINKTLQDRAVASWLASFKQKWVTGITMEQDPETGKTINPFESEIANIWVSEDADTRFGEFGATDLSNYTNVIDSLHKELSAISRIPQHLFNLTSGAFPSGEALRLAESPLNSKIEDKKVIIGDTLEDIFRLICEYKGYNVNVLETVWANKEPYSESEKLINASNKIALGIDSDTVLSELGYSLVNDSEIKM